MRILIATNELQHTAPGDYSFTVEGEIVTPVVAPCARPDDCGCGRGFPGLASGRATTTAMVVDRPFITPDDVRDAVEDWLERGGWFDLLADSDEADEIIDELLDEHVGAIAEVSAAFEPGTVLERRGDLVRARSIRHAA